MPPRRNLTPRRETQDDNNVRYVLFVNEYMDCLNPGEAYRRAGYKVSDEASAQASGRRLLRHARVQALLDNIKLKLTEEAAATASNTVGRLNLVYLTAMGKGDFMAAVAALRELGRHFGIYETDNQQKRYTPEDVEKLKKELEEKGFSFARVNDRSEN